MGRPKGSKNKPRDDAPLAGINDAGRGIMAALSDSLQAAPYAPPPPKPDFIAMALTDEDLAPVRRAKANHDKAAAKYRRDEIQAELRRKEIGEVEELSVPQVVAFDMSAAFNKVAAQKARAAGYRFVHNLRKTPDGWVFEASNSAKVKNDAPTDQP